MLPALVFTYLPLGWRGIAQETAFIGRVAGAAVLGLSVASCPVQGDGGPGPNSDCSTAF